MSCNLVGEAGARRDSLISTKLILGRITLNRLEYNLERAQKRSIEAILTVDRDQRRGIEEDLDTGTGMKRAGTGIEAERNLAISKTHP